MAMSFLRARQRSRKASAAKAQPSAASQKVRARQSNMLGGQKPFHLSVEILRVERFGEVSLGADFPSGHEIFFLFAAGEEKHRCFLSLFLALNDAAKLKAVHPGKHDV